MSLFISNTKNAYIILFCFMKIISDIHVLFVGIRYPYRMPSYDIDAESRLNFWRANVREMLSKPEPYNKNIGNKPLKRKIKWKDKKLYERKIGSITVINNNNNNGKVQKMRAKRTENRKKNNKHRKQINIATAPAHIFITPLSHHSSP